jgi:hypothetical protein
MAKASANAKGTTITPSALGKHEKVEEIHK